MLSLLIFLYFILCFLISDLACGYVFNYTFLFIVIYNGGFSIVFLAVNVYHVRYALIASLFKLFY